MSGLRQALAGYLSLRRGMGFKLDRDEKLLGQFITYLERRGAGTVTVADALAWATLPAGASPGWLRMRITVVRGFAAYLATLDHAAEVPPASLLSGGTRRAVPYLYSAADIAALMAQAERLRTPGGSPEPHQLAGPGGVDVQQPVAVIAGHPGRGLIVVQHRSGPQPLLERALEFGQAGGDPRGQAAGEPGRDRRAGSTPIRSAARSMLMCPLQASSAVAARTAGP
jgi:hypothetical protein